MKSLVIGGTGQLGANLVRALLEHGHQVRVLHRLTSNTSTIEGLDVERIVGDLNDGTSLRRACDGVQVVYPPRAIILLGPFRLMPPKGRLSKKPLLC